MLYIYVYFSLSPRCLLKMVVFECSKGVSYSTETKIFDKVDNNFSAFNPYTQFEKRYIIGCDYIFAFSKRVRINKQGE